MATAKISRIRIDYSDGSYDSIKLIQEGDFPLYSLDRNKARMESVSLGAHTAGAIAALMFMTAISYQQTEYIAHDPKVGALITAWRKVIEENPNN